MMLQLQFNNRVALSSCNRPASKAVEPVLGMIKSRVKFSDLAGSSASEATIDLDCTRYPRTEDLDLNAFGRACND